jgi:serine kinase of HPr protein (carbohydrate metabolism regulator)
MIAHAGLIARRRGGAWAGVLIEGPSGCGKSDLALRALGRGFTLVADDRVRLIPSGGALFGAAPEALAGLIEARGQGVVRRPFIPCARVRLRVACAAHPEAVERLPGPASPVILGVAVKTLDLWPFEAAAVDKIHLALDILEGSLNGGI